MSLATACPSCSTVFRVAQDQLKASEGWVRCGHCQKVFNAVEHLFDLDSRRSVSAGPRRGPAMASEPDDPNWQETAPAAFSNENLLRQSRAMRSNVSANSPAAPRQPDTPSPSSPPPSPDTSSNRTEDPAADRQDTGWSSTAFDFELPAGRKAPAAVPPSTSTAPTESRPVAREITPARVTPPPPAAAAAPTSPAAAPSSDEAEPSLFASTAAFAPDEQPDPLMQEVPHHTTTAAMAEQPGMAQMLARQETAAMLSITASRPAPLGATNNATLPRFVREADRRARWQRPWVRALLSLLALLLLGALAAQGAYQMRDRIAARWPQSKPILQSACAYLACQIKPPRLIDAIVVDNTALTRPPGVDGYRLSVVLRNRAEHIVAAPHLELNLTDTTGAVVVKRVFSPADFRISQAELAAQSEITWTLAFQVTGQNIAGYTLSAFYP